MRNSRSCTQRSRKRTVLEWISNVPSSLPLHPLGSLSFEESRKLGEVMAPDYNDDRGGKNVKTHTRSQTWPDEGETRVKEGCMQDCTEPASLPRMHPLDTKTLPSRWSTSRENDRTPSCSPSTRKPIFFIHAIEGVIFTLNYPACIRHTLDQQFISDPRLILDFTSFFFFFHFLYLTESCVA